MMSGGHSQNPGPRKTFFTVSISITFFWCTHTEMLMDHVIFIYFYHVPRIGLHEHLQETSPSIQYFMVKEPLVSKISSLFRGSPKDNPVNQHPNAQDILYTIHIWICYIYIHIYSTYYIYIIYIYIYIYIITYNIYIYLYIIHIIQIIYTYIHIMPSENQKWLWGESTM